MHLYLAQHGEAVSGEVDPRRPLTAAGCDAVAKTAAFAAQRGIVRANRIMHSGKERARQTAEIMAGHLNPPEGISKEPGLAPLDDPAIWAERLPEFAADVMLVGHLPHLSKLASWLLCQNKSIKTVDFRMGGIVCLGRDETGSWSVNWMISPDTV